MKNKNKSKKPFSIISFVRNYWVLLFFSAIILNITCIGINRLVKSYLIKKDGIQIKAVIVDEKNFWGNSPVAHTFSYSYQFKIDKEIYNGNSLNPDLKIGDSLLIEYVPYFPRYNRPFKKLN